MDAIIQESGFRSFEFLVVITGAALRDALVIGTGQSDIAMFHLNCTFLSPLAQSAPSAPQTPSHTHLSQTAAS